MYLAAQNMTGCSHRLSSCLISQSSLQCRFPCSPLCMALLAGLYMRTVRRWRSSGAPGAPEDLHRRTVRIYRPAKSAMQSGLHGNLHWRLDWDIKHDDNRWEHPVMFWAARYIHLLALSNHSADYMQGTRMNFNTKEDAIA